MGFSLQAALVALLQTSRLQAHNYQSELVSANLRSTNHKMLRFAFLIFHKRQKNYDRNRSSCVSLVELSDGRGQGMAEGPNHTTAKKAWSSINHSILSDLHNLATQLKI
jgi:hypothetical protein